MRGALGRSYRRITVTTPREEIQSLVDNFTEKLEGLIRKAALAAVHSALEATGPAPTRKPASPAKSTAKPPVKKAPAPKAPAPKAPAPKAPAPKAPAPKAPAPRAPAPKAPAPTAPAAKPALPLKPAPLAKTAPKPAPSKPAPSKPAPSKPAPSKPAPSKPAPSKPAASTIAAKPGKPAAPTTRIRRSDDQIDALANQIHEFIAANPGTGAEKVKGALKINKALWMLPIKRLIDQGRVISRGEKRNTVYTSARPVIKK
jgi:hypothetical protein